MDLMYSNFKKNKFHIERGTLETAIQEVESGITNHLKYFLTYQEKIDKTPIDFIIEKEPELRTKSAELFLKRKMIELSRKKNIILEKCIDMTKEKVQQNRLEKIKFFLRLLKNK